MYEEEASPRNKETTCLPEDEGPEEHDLAEPQEPPMMEMSRKKAYLDKRNYTRSRRIWSS